MASGDFTASQYSRILLKEEKMFRDSRAQRSSQYPIDTIQGLAERQKVDMAQRFIGNKCVGYQLTWLKSCGETVTDRLTTAYANCDFTGCDEIESTSLNVDKNLSLSKCFTVWDDQCKDSYTYEEKVAFEMARTKALLEHEANKKMIALLDSSTSPNEYTGAPGDTTTAPGETQIASANFTSELFAYFSIVGEVNRIYDPIIVSGTNMYTDYFLSRFKRDGCCDTDKIFMDGPYRIIFDLTVLEAVAGSQATYMVDAGTYAFWNTTEFDNLTPQLKAKDTYVWKSKSNRLRYRDGNTLKPVYFDVMMKRECKPDPTTGDSLKWGTVYDVSLKGGIFIGPVDCASHTGILKFVQV